MHPTNHYNIQRTNQASHRTSMYLLSGISAYFPIQTAPKVLALGSPCGALGRNTCVLKPLMASILYRKGISIDSVDCGSSCSNHGTSNKTANQTSELAAQTPFKKEKNHTKLPYQHHEASGSLCDTQCLHLRCLAPSQGVVAADKQESQICSKPASPGHS